MGFFEDFFTRAGAPSDAGKPNTAESDSDGLDAFVESDARDPRFDGWRIWISYMDLDNKRSNRWVRVYRVEARDFGDYLIGHCELRNETRAFRIDRIAAVADASGELHETDEFFEPYIDAPERPATGPDKSTPFGRALHIIDRLGDELRLLAFIAEADGRMGREEAGIIMRIAEMRARDIGLDLSKAEIVDLKRWLKAQHPDALAMQAAIRRMAGMGASGYHDVWSLVEIVAEADGALSPQETSALRNIKAAMDWEFEDAKAA
jgi:tellurite resistance protein